MAITRGTLPVESAIDLSPSQIARCAKWFLGKYVRKQLSLFFPWKITIEIICGHCHNRSYDLYV